MERDRYLHTLCGAWTLVEDAHDDAPNGSTWCEGCGMFRACGEFRWPDESQVRA